MAKYMVGCGYRGILFFGDLIDGFQRCEYVATKQRGITMMQENTTLTVGISRESVWVK